MSLRSWFPPGFRPVFVRLFVIFIAIGSPFDLRATQWRLYVGTYTSGDSEGIYSAIWDDSNGALRLEGLAAVAENPSFLALRGDDLLVAVNEITEYQGKASGYLTSYRIDSASGSLNEVNRVASEGGAPCHVAIDPSGSWALVANYVGGNAASFGLSEEGRLSEAVSVVQHQGSSVNERRQEGPHAHSVSLTPDGQFVFVADLGIDAIKAYSFNKNSGALTAAAGLDVTTAPGAGPRHFDFHPSAQSAYGINELNSTLDRFDFDAATGRLQRRQTLSTLPAGPVPGNSTADVHVHPNGRFVYGSNRGHDSIVVYRMEGPRGGLVRVENQEIGGRTPRNFSIDPTGNFLLVGCQNSDRITVFAIDGETGALTPHGEPLAVPSPVCLLFAPISESL